MSTTSLPPGPTSPALLQTLRMIANPLGYLEQCARRYGDTFTLQMAGLGTMVHLSAPEDLKVLFTADPDIAWAGEANHTLFGAIVGRGSLFTMESAAHLRRRRLLLPAFHGERMQEYADAMREITEQVVAAWPVGVPFALHPHMQTLALRVILRTVFGLDDGPQARHLTDLLARLANVAVASRLLMMPFLQWDLGPWSPWGRIVRLVRDTHETLDAEINRRRAEAADAAGSRSDVLSLLLQARDEQGQPLTDGQLRDELIVLLVAGHETTATTLAWAFETILSAPDVLARIREELRTVVGDGPLGRDQLGRLEYLDATIKEAIRLRPIIPTAGARRLKAPLVLRRHTLPAGIMVGNSEHLLHRRPDLYPDPDVFRPERFFRQKADPYEWTPFGGGVRRCLGMAFALYEIKVVLATVLARVPLSLIARPRPGHRGFFIPPADGTRVVRAAA